MTVQVASRVGLPTSATASTASFQIGRPSFIVKCRCMFSTTTMASSTRMPMEKIRAKRVMRFKV